MIKLFGKDSIKQRLDSLHESQHLPHAILLWGDSGVGKKTLARYISSLYLQGENSFSRNADRVFSDTHPDVFFAKDISTNDSKYTAESIREIVKSGVVKPIDGDIKVYIFNDFDEMSVLQQNILLKFIEEPPYFVKFVFTAQDLSKIITTIMSRVTAFNIKPANAEECKNALIELAGIDLSISEKLAEQFSGNIGNAINSLENSEDNIHFKKAISVLEALLAGSEYKLAVAFSTITKRDDVWTVIDIVMDLVRKSLKLAVFNDKIGEDICVKFAHKFSKKKLTDLMQLLLDMQKYRDANLNIPLLTSYISSEVMANINK